MRLTLKKFNLAALAALTVPSVLIFEASARTGVHLGARAGFYAALAGGVALLNQAMTRLGEDRAEGAAKPLGGAALALGAAAAILVFTVSRA